MLSVTVVGINYAPEVTGIGVYNAGLARFLTAKGHRVQMVTSFEYYPRWRKADRDQGVLFRQEWDGDVRVRRGYVYVPARPSVARRILHELSFVASALVSYLTAERADVTIIVSPPLALGLPVALLARLKRSKTLLHVQDLQPDAAVELGMMRDGALVRLLYLLERATYRVVDVVSVISGGMYAKLRTKGVSPERLVLFRNWADDDMVRPRSVDTQFRTAWGLVDRIVIMYSGNLGVKQGLDTLLEAAWLLRERDGLAFVVVGDGGEKPALQLRASKLGLGNIRFESLRPAEELSELLATADISVVPQREGVTDIVLPSKVANIMSSGRPLVVAAADLTELARIVREADCGIVVPPGDAKALAEALDGLACATDERARMGANGRRYVEENLTCRSVLESFERWLIDWSRGPVSVNRAGSIGKSETP
jgi:colanic acid biosynthesis glycosyl transferase WcaI